MSYIYEVYITYSDGSTLNIGETTNENKINEVSKKAFKNIYGDDFREYDNSLESFWKDSNCEPGYYLINKKSLCKVSPKVTPGFICNSYENSKSVVFNIFVVVKKIIIPIPV